MKKIRPGAYSLRKRTMVSIYQKGEVARRLTVRERSTRKEATYGPGVVAIFFRAVEGESRCPARNGPLVLLPKAVRSSWQKKVVEIPEMTSPPNVRVSAATFYSYQLGASPSAVFQRPSTSIDHRCLLLTMLLATKSSPEASSSSSRMVFDLQGMWGMARGGHAPGMGGKPEHEHRYRS